MTRVLIAIAAMGFVVAIGSFATAGLIGSYSYDAHDHTWRWGQPANYSGNLAKESGTMITREYPWAGGDSLHIDAPADVTYTQGPTSKLTISGPKALLDRLIVQSDRIGFDAWMDDVTPLTIVVTAPHVTDFETTGVSSLSIANYRQDVLALGVSGSGNVIVKGEAKTTALRISGSGQTDLSGLAGDDMAVQIAGSGGATIAPKQSANIQISGSGHVSLLTRPVRLSTQTAGSGSITVASAN